MGKLVKKFYKLLKKVKTMCAEEVQSVAMWLIKNPGDTTQLVEMALTSENINVQKQGVLFVLSMVTAMDRKDWQKLEKTLPKILEIFTNLARSNSSEDVETLLQAFCQLCQHRQGPLFFKSHFKRMASMMIEMANSIEHVQASSRHLAHEFIVSM